MCTINGMTIRAPPCRKKNEIFLGLKIMKVLDVAVCTHVINGRQTEPAALSLLSEIDCPFFSSDKYYKIINVNLEPLICRISRIGVRILCKLKMNEFYTVSVPWLDSPSATRLRHL